MTGTTINTPIGAGPRRWGQRWLDRLEQAGSGSPFSAESVERGRSYALHDWQLEVHIDRGVAETTARSGPRISHDVTFAVPPLTDEQFDQFLELIAASGARTAALLDRQIDLDLIDEAFGRGVDLLPPLSQIQTSCGCQDPGEICKHVAALAFLLGDAFDADPFDLLLLRGKSHADIVQRVTELRGTGENDTRETPLAPVEEISASDDAETVWAILGRGELPTPLTLDDRPGKLPDWGGPPPPRSPFTAVGLASVARDGVRRAHATLMSGDPTHLDLDRASDVARRAEHAIQAGLGSQLATNAALTPHELRARLTAFQVAGPAGVRVVERAVDTRRVDADRQYRQSAEGLWFRFEKPKGRWQLAAGPFAQPDADPDFADGTDPGSESTED